MNIEKLKSGSYRLTQMVDGKRYRTTVDHKPTNAEAIRIMSKLIERTPSNFPNKAFKDAYKDYLAIKDNVLSPSTIRGYKYLYLGIGEDLRNKKLNTITSADIQKCINDYSKDHSPKTVKNLSALILAVLNQFDVHLKPPTLPQKEVKENYIPTEEDVHRILDEIHGSKFECAILLSVMGLRRSEICALDPVDLSEDNVLFIHKGKVQTSDGSFVVRQKAKNDTSTRKLVLPPYIADLIREQGFIYNGHPNSILDALKAVEKRLGIPTFPPHKMRHFFVSYLHKKGYSDKVIQQLGGWSSSAVMERIYKHAMEVDEAKANVASEIGNLF